MHKFSPIFAAAVFSSLALPSAALAEPILVDTVELIYTGTVSYDIADMIELSNPDGSTTSVSGSDVNEFPLANGSEASVRFTFAGNDPALSNSACGGRYSLGTAQQSGPCSIATRVETPFNFSAVGFGGNGGDMAPSINGLVLVEDPATGEYSIEVDGSQYDFSYAVVPNYQYTSATGTLGGLGDPCISAFNCFEDVATGTLGSLAFDLLVTGDFGLIQPGFSVGYNAGSVGTLNILGDFRFTNIGNPQPVPAPGMLALFGLGLAAVMGRRRFRK